MTAPSVMQMVATRNIFNFIGFLYSVAIGKIPAQFRGFRLLINQFIYL
jgi:hypothetical protein